ncbi:hypothetical protein Tco_1298846 [Tanacetum coccineum]
MGIRRREGDDPKRFYLFDFRQPTELTAGSQPQAVNRRAVNRRAVNRRAVNSRLDMKAMQDNVKAGLIPFMTDQEILDEIVPSDNRQNMSGMGRKLPGDIEAKEQENELLRKQAEEAQQRAYLAALKADSADQRASAAYQSLVINSNLASSSSLIPELPRFITNPHMNDARSIEQLAQDNARGEDNNESASGEDEEGEEGEQHSSDGDYSSESE